MCTKCEFSITGGNSQKKNEKTLRYHPLRPCRPAKRHQPPHRSRHPGKNLRGQREGYSRKTSENKINDIKEHIQSLPQFESHYTRRITIQGENI